MTELFRCRDGHVSSVHRPGKMTCFFCPRPVERLPDFDRLRDERDRAVEGIDTYVSALAVTREQRDEARRVAGVLADALRNNAPCYCDHPLRAGLPPCSRCSALAVFDTLTEEKTDE